MAAPTAQQNPLFPLLVAKYGFSAATTIMNLLNPEAPAISKGLGTAGAVGQAANLAGRYAGSAGLAELGRGLGTAAGLGNAGYGIYNAATAPGLSTKQRAGHAGGAAADAVASYYVPYYGWVRAINAIGQNLEGSGSPQVRGFGRSLDQLATPQGGDAFNSFLQGDTSLKGAWKKAGGVPGLVTDLLGPVGVIAKGLGVDKKVAKNVMDFGPIPGGGKLASMLGIMSKPTTGTSYRQGLQGIFGKLGLQDFNRSDKNAYNAPKSGAVSPEALAMGAYLGSYAPGFDKNPEAYANQAANILTNTYGQKLPDVLKGLNTKLQLTPAEALARFQSLKLSPDFLNRLQTGSVLFGAAAKK